MFNARDVHMGVHLTHCSPQVGFINCVIPLEDGHGLMSCDCPAAKVVYARTAHTSHEGVLQIVRYYLVNPGFSTSDFKSPPHREDALPRIREKHSTRWPLSSR